MLRALARTPWRHRVVFRVQDTPGRDVERRLPLGLAVVEPVDGPGSTDRPGDGWVRVRLNAERLDWVPALIAGLGLPFVLEEPEELRGLMRDFAGRLLAMSGREDPEQPGNCEA